MNLLELEARLQSLIEVDLMSFLPGTRLEDVIIQKLAAALDTQLNSGQKGGTSVPDVFTVIVHPTTAEKLRDYRLIETLIRSLLVVGEEAGYRFSNRPTITISPDESLSINDARVLTSHSLSSITDTLSPPGTTQELIPPIRMTGNAFLIVDGVKVFSLLQPVINIGRRMDNQLVIDDPRISRNHAQLRIINGRYVVFDLNSTGGTFVNGQRTSQSVIYPGDVISLAGVALVFGQDNPLPHTGLKDTAPLPNQVVDRPTAFIKDQTSPKIRKK